MPYVWFTILCIAHSGSNCKTVFRAVLPLLIGCMIAYVVNILMCFYEKGMQEYAVWQPLRPLQRPLCMTLSYLSLVLVILILWWMIVLSCYPASGSSQPISPGFRITV